MANLRGGQKLWDSVNVAADDSSALAIPGVGQYVALFVKNEDAGVDGVILTVQAAVTDDVKAGRNAIDDTDPDGGLDWFDYTTDGTTPVTLTVSHGAAAMIDVSPFAPQFIRLVRTDNGATAVLSAWVSSFGGE